MDGIEIAGADDEMSGTGAGADISGAGAIGADADIPNEKQSAAMAKR
jgi:hypothetical protein